MGTRNAPAKRMPNGDAASQNQGTPAAGNDLLAEWPLDVPDMSCIERALVPTTSYHKNRQLPAQRFVNCLVFL